MKLFSCQWLVAACCLLFTADAWAQSDVKVYPTHWWTGMKNRKLQLMVYRPTGLTSTQFSVSSGSPDVKVLKFNRPDQVKRHYLFIDLEIAPNAKPGIKEITIVNFIRSEHVKIQYELKARNPETGKTRNQGITSEDLIYLIMPDRFSNGDPTNDRIAGLRDQSLNRAEIFDRHGGDLKGIENHLDYLQDLGVTALWLNPVLQNDMPQRTEHGYAATDHYTIEPRLGGAAAYHSLSNALHKRGMKLIQDAVYNHVGIEHFLFRDLPDSSWFHFWPNYTNTTYKDQVLMDPYVSAIDKKKMSDGWFVPSMPDLNQKNPFVANFLIQHAIWCTEEFGLDGWRIDTYAYNDLEFMNRCNKALLDQYPTLHIFGETWVHGIPNQSFFAENVYQIPFKSNLPAVTDFQLNLYGITPALNQPFGWTEGVNRLYLTASNDFVYKHPMKQVIFLDNHDLSRFLSIVNDDVKKLKIGLAWLLTFRGIPQLYYGTEVMMKNHANPDGLVRLDFPGGWPGDAANKFTAGGRTSDEDNLFNYTRALAQFRKSSSAIKTGKLMQYVPEDGVYVYFRYDAQQTVMCIMNPSDDTKEISTARFEERLKGFTKAREVATNEFLSLGSTLKIPAKTQWVLELK
ncbi:glycoside hydrolase family 13 protein [Paraflavitalea sp. CAU 1676]|uniref:glycoside hydrolase family 13 protein n=1 Tax=Paraflavitalea sp. CAU 1676 TaxID=3032598 RepID=UPI0023DC01A2|nr:glycoside hydrolase family 13 protein [Paraflavitalea sp. CAU 1676]MDF2189240.1 glycoside hydrolase family 13 protein [Paraflavitalea sp. CAU 1676]